MKVLIFGTGNYYERYKKWIPKENVVALLDNSKNKWGSHIDGHLVISPADIADYEFDRVYIFSVYCREMKEQLLGLGVPEGILYSQFDLYKEIGGMIHKVPIRNVSSAPSARKHERRILLLSNDLQLNGAAIALYYLAAVLAKSCDVTVAAAEGGGMEEKFAHRGFEVIIDANLQIETMRHTDYIQDYDLIICNTLYFYHFLSDRDTHHPVIWWLHDGPLYYEGMDKSIFEAILKTNLWVYGVGNIAMQSFLHARPDMSISDLLYGLEDWHKSCKKKTEAKLLVAVVGSVQYRKGQDVFVQAVRLMPESVRGKARFVVVGDDTSLYASELKESCRDLIELEFLGNRDRDYIENLYSRLDILVCPSREDPMPIVVTEAMMNGKCCIVSEAAGNSRYIEHGRTGLVFPSEDATRLKELMEYLINAPERIDAIGANGRSIFDKYFSMDILERNISGILDNKIWV